MRRHIAGRRLPYSRQRTCGTLPHWHGDRTLETCHLPTRAPHATLLPPQGNNISYIASQLGDVQVRVRGGGAGWVQQNDVRGGVWMTWGRGPQGKGQGGALALATPALCDGVSRGRSRKV